MREESNLLVKDSCFLDNDFTGQGTITVQTENSVVDANGNFVSEDDDLRCPLVAVVDSGDCEEATATGDLCVALQEAAPERRRRSGVKAAATDSAASAGSVTNGAVVCLFLLLFLY